MTAIEKLIATAESQIGYLEKKTNSQLDSFTANAGRNNWNKYARDFDEKYPTFYNGRKNGYDWCDIFVDWCFVTAFGFDIGRQMLYQPLKSCGAGCSWSKSYYKKNNRLYTTPKVGDQVFYGTDHTGIVVRVVGNKFYTVEGNTSGGNTVISNGGGVAYKGPYTIGGTKTFGRPNWTLVGGDSYPVPLMSYDETSTNIKYLQQDLNALGYPCDTPDGHYGPKTRTMVLNFQSDNKLDKTGNVDHQTWNKMLSIVKNLQKNLNTLGFNCDTPDGIAGPLTVAAITNFQKANKLTANGVANSAVIKAIEEAVANKNKPVVSKYMVAGSQGSNVKELQVKLNKLGFMCDTPDGNFGPKTLQAVNDFQDAVFNEHDGEVGPNTMGKIDLWLGKIYTAQIIATSGLYIRSKPVASSAKLTALSYGAKVNISVIKDGFGKLAGREGWAMLKWTKKV